jgi:hypothetical protein
MAYFAVLGGAPWTRRRGGRRHEFLGMVRAAAEARAYHARGVVLVGVPGTRPRRERGRELTALCRPRSCRMWRYFSREGLTGAKLGMKIWMRIGGSCLGLLQTKTMSTSTKKNNHCQLLTKENEQIVL